jgi:hypothetical protein
LVGADWFGGCWVGGCWMALVGWVAGWDALPGGGGREARGSQVRGASGTGSRLGAAVQARRRRLLMPSVKLLSCCPAFRSVQAIRTS